MNQRREADDVLFGRFVAGLFVVLLLYGGGMVLVIALGNDTLGAKMIGGFGSMFAGLLGLGSGYLLGSRR